MNYCGVSILVIIPLCVSNQFIRTRSSNKVGEESSEVWVLCSVGRAWGRAAIIILIRLILMQNLVTPNSTLNTTIFTSWRNIWVIRLMQAWKDDFMWLNGRQSSWESSVRLQPLLPLHFVSLSEAEPGSTTGKNKHRLLPLNKLVLNSFPSTFI